MENHAALTFEIGLNLAVSYHPHPKHYRATKLSLGIILDHVMRYVTGKTICRSLYFPESSVIAVTNYSYSFEFWRNWSTVAVAVLGQKLKASFYRG